MMYATASKVLERFYKHWGRLVRKGTTSGLNSAETSILGIFSNWLAENGLLAPSESTLDKLINFWREATTHQLLVSMGFTTSVIDFKQVKSIQITHEAYHLFVDVLTTSEGLVRFEQKGGEWVRSSR